MEQPKQEDQKFPCPHCTKEKIRDEFGTINGGRNKWCKMCCAEAVRRCYANNVEYRESAKAAGDRRVLRNHRFLYAYLRSHPCVDCGEVDPLILQFDHVTEGTKTNDVTGLSDCCLTRILREIALCVVRCGNCHLRKTAIALNHVRYQICKEATEKEKYPTMDELLAEETVARQKRYCREENPFFGKHHTEEARTKMRMA